MRSFTKLKIRLLGLAFVPVGFLSYGQVAISGQVTDSDGDAWLGVTLQKGTTNGTVTYTGAISPAGLDKENIMISMYPII